MIPTPQDPRQGYSPNQSFYLRREDSCDESGETCCFGVYVGAMRSLTSICTMSMVAINETDRLLSDAGNEQRKVRNKTVQNLASAELLRGGVEIINGVACGPLLGASVMENLRSMGNRGIAYGYYVNWDEKTGAVHYPGRRPEGLEGKVAVGVPPVAKMER